VRPAADRIGLTVEDTQRNAKIIALGLAAFELNLDANDRRASC